MLQIHKRMKRSIGLSEAQWYTKLELWTALKSLPGGLRQGIHRDYPSCETSKAILEKDVVQASVIVALMPNTHFVIYPGCFGTYVDRDKVARVTLTTGEFLLFRGELVHAGAEYKRMNIRLHCYVRVRGIKQNPDSTEAVVFSSYMCVYCTMQCHSKLHRRNHQRFCKDNPEKEKQKAQRAAAEARGGRCNLCNMRTGSTVCTPSITSDGTLRKPKQRCVGGQTDKPKSVKRAVMRRKIVVNRAKAARMRTVVRWRAAPTVRVVTRKEAKQVSKKKAARMRTVVRRVVPKRTLRIRYPPWPIILSKKQIVFSAIILPRIGYDVHDR
ncbi:hypothetical protein PHMEG_00030989 [Phytophthora megakarya]|uniref:Uncharacterized protein n=1 Tax=Phytophthora megakarya TaxID=4795 RepID=A0A225UZP2_9STRA|nr:hypothetical protein PHMEG_00030989 [Phytophthora megakarya]